MPRDFGGGEAVEDDGRRIGAFFVAHDLGARALRPDRQLLGGCGAKRVAGDEHDRMPALALLRGELADRRRLAGAVDADDQHHVRYGPHRNGADVAGA